jgi:hypothetical protein
VVNIEKVLVRQLITQWHERAQIDYSDLYVRQYIAYNAWFRKVTNCDEDYEAIRLLLKRFVIWDDYMNGRTMINLSPIVQQIATVTHRHPIGSTSGTWDGTVKDAFDWRGLIYFWYHTRCNLFHGVTMPGHVQHDNTVRLAYQSLSLFMGEIVRRMRYCFNDTDFTKLTEVRALLQSQQGPDASLREIEAKLYQKFIHSPDIWNVDMERV